MSSLAKKLRIKAGSRVLIFNAPGQYQRFFSDLPKDISVSTSAGGEFDVVLVFFTRKSDLDRHIGKLKAAMGEKCILWVCYPKGTSKMETDLNRDILFAHLLTKGLKAVAQVAIDESWSAMWFKKK